jgi:uncharacterized protein YkwD
MQTGVHCADIWVVHSARHSWFFARKFAALTLVLTCAFAWSASSAQADARADCPGSDATFTGTNLAALRAAVICLTNRERIARGMAALNEESHLTNAAQVHSADMAENNYFDHTDRSGGQPWDRTKTAGYASGWVGENIAAGYPTPYAVVLGWMKSSGHCKNILNSPYVDIGIGVAKDSSSSYGVYWTMVLGGHSSAGAAAVTCPYSTLTDGTVPGAGAPDGSDTGATAKPKVTSVKRRSDGRYRVKGTLAKAAKGTRIKLTVKRGKKSRTYSVTTNSSGSFAKTVRAPRGSGKVRVVARVTT